jgi:hypothetical protein
MKSFSHWLAQRHPELGNDLAKAIDAYNQVFAPGSNPRGNVRALNEGTLRNLANTWQKALFTYKAEVVDLTYARLDAVAARTALTVEWDRLLHNNGKLTFSNLDSMKRNIDEFSKQFRLKKGTMAMWEDVPMASPDTSSDGFIPIIGEGFSTSYTMDVPDCIRYSGTTEVEAASRKEFERGMPGSAWIGLLVIAERTGLPNNMIFLLPASHMEKHVTAPHKHEQRGLSTPIPQFASAGHQGGVVMLIKQRRMHLGTCNRCLPLGTAEPDPTTAAGYGCIMGFAMVKAYDAVGHQWAFTSQTCNVSATGIWENPAGEVNRLRTNGGMQLPTDWAVAIWRATRDFKGMIVGATYQVVSAPEVHGNVRNVVPNASSGHPEPVGMRGEPPRTSKPSGLIRRKK